MARRRRRRAVVPCESPASERARRARARRDLVFVQQCQPLEKVLPPEARLHIVNFLDIRSLVSVEGSSRMLRRTVGVVAHEIFRSAAVARFPVLEAQAAYLPTETCFRRAYRRHLSILSRKDSLQHRPPRVEPTSSLEDYVFTLQVSNISRETVFVASLDEDELKTRRLDDDVAADVLRSLGQERGPREGPRLRVDCLHKASGRHALLYIDAECEGEDDGVYYFEWQDVEIRRRPCAHFAEHIDGQSDIDHDYCLYPELACRYNSHDARFSIRFLYASDFSVDDMPPAATLVLLEHDLVFLH